MSLQALIEKIRKRQDLQSEVIAMFSSDVLKLIEACEIAMEYLELHKGEYFADMARESMDQICAEVEL